MYYKKTPDQRFGEGATKSGSEKPDDMKAQKRKHQKNTRKHRSILDYIIQVQDMRNKETNETPTRVYRS